MPNNNYEHTYEYFAIITKYGYITMIGEDTYISEGILENVGFASHISRAKLFSSKTDTAPRYARGVKKDSTLEDWANAINGEFVDVKKVKGHKNINTVINGLTSYRIEHSLEYLYIEHKNETDGFMEFEFK